MELKRFFIFILVIVLLALLSIYYPKLTGEAVSNNQEYEKESAFVNRVIDGDTIVVGGYDIDNEADICLLGINTKSIQSS